MSSGQDGQVLRLMFCGMHFTTGNSSPSIHFACPINGSQEFVTPYFSGTHVLGITISVSVAGKSWETSPTLPLPGVELQ